MKIFTIYDYLTYLDLIMYCTHKILFSKFANCPLILYFVLDNFKLKILFNFFYFYFFFFFFFSLCANGYSCPCSLQG